MQRWLPMMVLVAWSLPVQARPKTVESRASSLHIPTLAHLAERGEVAFIESPKTGKIPQVIMLAKLTAPPARVWDVIMDVARYPQYLKSVSDIDVLGNKRGLVAFEWKVGVPFFSLAGSRLQRGKRPFVVETRGHRGNLRGTRERWELFSIDGGQQTLAAFYRAIDVETGGFLLKTMVELEPSMEQGANLSTGFVHIRGLSSYLSGEKPPTPAPKTGPVPPFRKFVPGQQGLDLARLRPLLEQGQLTFVESYRDGGLKQATLLTLIRAPKAKIAGIIADPAKYPEFIPNFAEQEVTKLPDGRLHLKWELEVPLVNLTGTSYMTIEPQGAVSIDANDGDITRGRWRWDLFALDPKTTVAVHTIYTDVRDASWVTRQIVDSEPLFEHGIVLASGTVALSAMKARAEGDR